MIGYPIEDAGWIARTLASGLTPDAKLETAPGENVRATSGWPIHLVRAAITVDGKPVELRLGAFFRFLEWGAAVLVRSNNEARLRAALPEIVEVLKSASFDSEGRVHSVHELFEGLETAE